LLKTMTMEVLFSDECSRLENRKKGCVTNTISNH